MRVRRFYATSPSALYRLYGADKTLIYVGISHEPATRIGQHLNKAWGDEVTDWTIEWFEDRPVCERAEHLEISTHRPKYNVSSGSRHHAHPPTGRSRPLAVRPTAKGQKVTAAIIAEAYADIARAEQRYREVLRAGLANGIRQADIAKTLGRTREALRRDAMADEERAKFGAADAKRKRTKSGGTE